MRRRGTASRNTVKTRRRKTTKASGASISARSGHSSVVNLQEKLKRQARELDEAREERAAIAEVLRIISSSPGELEPVFQSILENATRICEAKFGTLFRFDGKNFHPAAQFNTPAELLEEQTRRGPFEPSPGTAIEHVMRTKQVSHSADKATELVPGFFAAHGGARSQVAVPVLKDHSLIGVIVIYRQEVRPFTDKQIALLTNFAAQAVIAIENTRLLNELRELLDQQTATADVLRVISSSPGELTPVFNAMLENATRICEAKFGNLFLHEGSDFRAVAVHGDSYYADWFRRDPVADMRKNPGSPLNRVRRSKQVVHIPDLRLDQSYLGGNPRMVALVDTAGARTELVVPMLKEEDELIGAIVIYRQEVRPFTDKQVELVKNFAAQAVIAIENTRLLSELRQSLEQQTATADVLRVISLSPGDLQPVFQAMLENAVRICEAQFGVLYRFDGSAFRFAAEVGAPLEYTEFNIQRGAFQPVPGGQLERVMLTKQMSLTVDDAVSSNPGIAARLAGARSQVIVPMLKDNDLVGAIIIYRQEVRPFTEKQTALLSNFAAQAVIAIENTRLLNELRQSLQQQTATAEVLSVINSSPGDLKPVFEAMLENAVQLCGAKFGNIYRWSGDALHLLATHNTPPAFAEARRNLPFRPGPDTPTGRMLVTKTVTHVADLAAESRSTEQDDRELRFGVDVGGIRTLLSVPMLKEDELIGAFTIYRQEVQPFTDKQIELVKNFAAQAVIAIENTRLLNELRELLQQQTATADVLRVISSSPGELEPVFQAMLENATRICGAKFGTLYLSEGEGFRAAAMHNAPPAYAQARAAILRPHRDSSLWRAAADRQVVQVEDVTKLSGYVEGDRFLITAVADGGFRTVLSVPMLKDEALVGVITIYRQEVHPFTDKQIELLKNFAAQAVIAIENTRLLNELRQRTTDLTQSLEDLRTAQDRLVQTEKLASLGQLTAGIAHEIKNPLNFVNNFSAVSVELIDELRGALGSMHLDEKQRGEINEIADTLQGNLDKVVQHGKRADAIVKNMLLHSRQGSGEHRPVDVNALVEESLNLAYHGARAEKQGFNVTLERSFDPAAGEADLFPQDITRVLLNLISNGFYASIKRKAEANGGDYEPTVTAATKSLGDRVEIRIRDNGTGIPPEVKAKLFSPFFTTKPAGEGTGLGLSISHDIIVKQHGGSIEVDTKPGEFTEFRIVLPRAGASLIELGEHA